MPNDPALDSLESIVRAWRPLVPDTDQKTFRREAVWVNAAHLGLGGTRFPWTVSKGVKVARGELTKAIRHAIALAKTLDAMHLEARKTLEAALPSKLKGFDAQLIDFAKSTILARIRLSPDPTRNGRPKASHARAVAEVTGKSYERLTGRRPSLRVNAYAKSSPTYGPFLKFLGETFAALKITESPEAIWRAILTERRRKK